MEAELHDGTILEFPDGTDPQVIQATVKKMLGQTQPQQSARQEGRDMNSSVQGGITALQGPSMGFLDELAGAGSAITGAIANLTPWGDDKTIAENYRSGRDKVRGATEQYTQDYPTTALTSQIAASAPLIAIGKGKEVAGMLPKIWEGSKVGAKYGSVSGLGASESEDVSGIVEDTATGGGVGLVAGGALAGLVSGAGRSAGYLKDLASGDRSKVNASNIAKDVLGKKRAEIEGILKSANPNQTSGQAVAMAGGGNRDEFLALANLADKKGNPDAIRAMSEAQGKGNAALIAKVSGGASEEASIAAQKTAHDTLNKTLDPLRIKGAEAANRNTKNIEMLRKKAADYSGKASDDVEDVRRFTAAGERATERANTTSPIGWMPRVSGKYTYMGEKGGLADRAEQVATDAAQDSLKAGASANVAKNLLEANSAKGISTLSAKPLLNELDAKLAKVGDRANPEVRKTLEGFKNWITDPKNNIIDKDGNIDAYDLHQLRKNTNQMVDALFPNAEQALKNRAGAILSGMKPTMDAGLKAAGGGDLVKYFDEFSGGMNKINKMKMASMIQKMSPDELIQLTKGNNTKLVEDIFGRGRVSFKTEMGKDANPIFAVAKRLEADALLKRRGDAPAAQNALQKTLEKDMLGFRLPAYLNMTASTANKVLSKFEGWMNDNTRKILFEAMQSPKKTTALMNTLPASERIKFLKALSDPEVRKMMSGQAGIQVGQEQQ